MKIANVEIIPITIPFSHGGKTAGPGLSLQSWSSLNTMLVRIETDDGIVGWGEAFCYNSQRAIQGVL